MVSHSTVTTHLCKAGDWYYTSAAELVMLIANKSVSAVELLQATITRIEQLDEKINAIVIRDFARAYEAARAADAAIARGERRPLLGLPMTVKESFNVLGLPTTWGNPLYENWQPSVNALVIERLQAAGAVIIGKTNVPFLLKDWQSYNDLYGTTYNPWDVQRTPGGSSGGAAAALAAGLIALELGSDLAGSLRVPAHFCGISSHKPSLDLVPMFGAVPPTVSPYIHRNDLAVIGPMARTASDLVLELNVIAGPEPSWDGKGYQLNLPPARHRHLQEFRVLVLEHHPLGPTEQSIQRAIQRLVENLRKVGVAVSCDSQLVPDLKQIAQTYALLLTAFGVNNIPLPAYQQLAETASQVAADDDSLTAHLLRGYTMTHRDWLSHLMVRRQLRHQWCQLFKAFDVILCPVASTVAFLHDHQADFASRRLDIDGSSFNYVDQFIWSSIATLFDLPATVVPIDRGASALPIGIQIIGDYLEDHTTLMFAQLLEREFGGFSPPPQ